jgi:hypothetical protein
MKAYTTGKLKAKGKLTDLLKLQKLLWGLYESFNNLTFSQIKD